MVLLYSFLVLLYFSLLYCIPSWFSSDLIPHIFSPVFATWISCPPYQGILSTQTGYIVLQTWKSCLSNLNIPTSQSGYPILLTWISYPPNQDILSSPPRYPVHSPGLEISPLPFFLCPYFPSFCPPNWIFRRAPVFICPPYLSSPHTLVSPARWIQFYRAKWKKRGGVWIREQYCPNIAESTFPYSNLCWSTHFMAELCVSNFLLHNWAELKGGVVKLGGGVVLLGRICSQTRGRSNSLNRGRISPTKGRSSQTKWVSRSMGRNSLSRGRNSLIKSRRRT